jgi:hypothetical protein
MKAVSAYEPLFDDTENKQSKPIEPLTRQGMAQIWDRKHTG